MYAYDKKQLSDLRRSGTCSIWLLNVQNVEKTYNRTLTELEKNGILYCLRYKEMTTPFVHIRSLFFNAVKVKRNIIQPIISINFARANVCLLNT